MKASIHEYAEDWKFGSKMYAIDLLQRYAIHRKSQATSSRIGAVQYKRHV